jgi:rubrerythrin
MESEDLTKTLTTLKAISDLELAIAELYRYFSEFRASERDFWIALEEDEQKHARLVQKMGQMLLDRKFFCAPNGSFNESAVTNLKNFVERHHRKLQKLEIPTDFKSLLSIAWNVEYSLSEMNYVNLFSIAEGEFESLLLTITSETAVHRSKLGSKITVMRNSLPRSHHRLTPRENPGIQRKVNPKAHLLKSS